MGERKMLGQCCYCKQPIWENEPYVKYWLTGRMAHRVCDAAHKASMIAKYAVFRGC